MLQIKEIKNLKKEEEEEIISPSALKSEERRVAVGQIIKDVRMRGDVALAEMAEQFDGWKGDLRVSEQEITSAGEALPLSLREAIDRSIQRIEDHHQGSSAGDWQRETDGLITGERYLPIESVALYVPGGKGRFPSVAAMLAVPAKLAGVGRIVIVSPPSSSGPDPASLYIADKMGIDEFYLLGGAGAIAALAYGTKTIPPVSKVVGPGGAYVQEAKNQLASILDTGPPAGPSEALIIADESADPVTLSKELLVEAEHGPDSKVLLISTDRESLQEVARILPGIAETLPAKRKEYVRSVLGRDSLLLADDIDEAILFANRFAPEHLRIYTKDDQGVYEKIENAGEVLLGPYTSIALGNYSAGANAVLPTARFARSVSCLGVLDFQKRNSYVRASRESARELAGDAAEIAEYEGFAAHARAARDLLP